MNYGIPYQGSKSKILKDICRYFPPAENFYDLFGGGFSVTHFMLIHRRKHFKNFHYNEIRKGVPELIQDAINGKYNYNVFKPEFISREKFFATKDKSTYVKLIWSFGNNGKDYLFGKDVEPTKKSLHNAIIFNEFDQLAKDTLGITKFKEGIGIRDRRLYLRNRLVVLKEKRCDLERLQQLEQLERLQQLEQLERLQQLNFYNTDYREIGIKPNSVIYCDIPYLGTGEYDKNKNFNHDDFFEWASKIEYPLFISEYSVRDKRFKEIWSKDVKSIMAPKAPTPAKEKLFCNKIAYDILRKKTKSRH